MTFVRHNLPMSCALTFFFPRRKKYIKLKDRFRMLSCWGGGKQALTAATLAALSDVLAQRLTSRKAPFNWRRTLAISLFGFLWTGPSNHFWQLLLESLFQGAATNSQETRKRSWTASKKVLLDQLTYGPLNNVLFMIFMAKVIEGRSWRTTLLKMKADYPAIQLRGWRFWPVAQLINQTVVPLHLRVLWTNCVAFAWSTFLILRSKSAGNINWLPIQKQRSM